MQRINSSRPLFLAAVLLATGLLASGASARAASRAGAPDWADRYYDGSAFDMNDELQSLAAPRRLTKAAHRNDPNATPTGTAVTSDGTVQTVGVVKNDELLPTNLFVTPDILLNETHPKTETEGYLQVLQAMKYTPVVAEAAPGARVVQAKAGLNGALLKILTITKQITSEARSTVTSNSVTINQILQNYAGLAFGNVYNEFNGTAAAPVQTQAVEVAPAENKTVLNFANGTKVVLQGDIKTDASGQVVGNDAAAAEAQAQIAAQAEIPKRLLTLMRLYAEHVEHKDKDIIADEAHYGHIKSMDRHLACLADAGCDFEKHLAGVVGAPAPRSRHALEAYMASNREFRPNHLAQFESQIASLIKALPGMTSNEDIKRASADFIAKNQQALSDLQTNWPATNTQLQAQLAQFKADLPLYQNLSPEQFLAMLNQLSITYKAKIDQEFTANGLSAKVEELNNARNGIVSLHAALKEVLPANGVLNADFTALENRLAKHIAIFQRAQNATPEQLNAARIKLKNNLQMQINGLDPEANAAAIRSIANDADAIMKSDFGKSLNKENLDFVVQKSINALKADFDQMKDGQKASGFMLDQADLQRLADDVVDELKKSREANQRAVINLKDFHKLIQQENKMFSAEPNSGNPASDAADLLISYENYYYDALSSDTFYADLKDYIAKYYDVYHAHAAPLEPFFNYSAAYKTLTAGLNNPNALGGLNQQAVRMLLKSGEQQVAHLASLSDADKHFFHLLDHLTAEWAQTADPVAFNRKLGAILGAVQGQANGLTSAHLLAASDEHKAFALFESVKNAILGVIQNLGTSATAATGLANTIGQGQQLVKSAADQYQVTDLLTGNSTASGVIGGIKNKVKSWLGWRNLEVHYGISDTISSVQNLWKSITEAKDTAEKLKTTINEAQGFANNVQQGINAFNSIVGAAA